MRQPTMYTSCISATFKRKPSEGVGHDLTNHTSLLSRFIAYSGSIREEIRPEFRSQPKRCVQGSRDTKRVPGIPGHVPTASQPTPYGQRCPRPPVGYKHQKLLATPGQRTRVDKKSSGVIFQGPMDGSS